MTATIIKMKDWVSKKKPLSKGRPSLAQLCGDNSTQGTRTIPEIKKEIRAYIKEHGKVPSQ